MEPKGSLPCSQEPAVVGFCNKLALYDELLAPRPIPKLQDHPFSAARDILFNICDLYSFKEWF
jgi:hypothetical protein